MQAPVKGPAETQQISTPAQYNKAQAHIERDTTATHTMIEQYNNNK